jgi:hypothetical protein
LDSPDAAIAADTFSVRWEGLISSRIGDVAQMYTLYVLADDGVRVWFNNQLVIDAWTNRGEKEFSADVGFVGDTSYPIKIEYCDITGNAKIVSRCATKPGIKARSHRM